MSSDFAARDLEAPSSKNGEAGTCDVAPAASAASFTVAEAGLVKKMGVSRAIIRAMRNRLKRGVDWIVEGKNVLLTSAAAQLLAQRMSNPDAPDPGEQTPPTGQMVSSDGPLREEMTVIRRVVNPHLVQCRRANDETIFVRVSSNAHFREKMVLRAQRDSDGWTLIGRTPRYPGKW